jgi:hypothetical protein
MPVAFSRQGDLLRFSQPQWLATLRLGAGLVVFATWAFVAVIIVLVITSAVLRFSVSSPLAVMSVIFALAYLTGSWLLSTPMYLSMLSRFGRRFEQAATAARLNWRKSSMKLGDIVPAAASPP